MTGGAEYRVDVTHDRDLPGRAACEPVRTEYFTAADDAKAVEAAVRIVRANAAGAASGYGDVFTRQDRTAADVAEVEVSGEADRVGYHRYDASTAGFAVADEWVDE